MTEYRRSVHYYLSDYLKSTRWVAHPTTKMPTVAGNMTYDATASLNYTFDQENRVTGANGYGYIYDGDGNRVEKVTPSTNPTSGTLYWYMTPGVVAESDLTGAITSEYIFFDGERVARKDFTGCHNITYGQKTHPRPGKSMPCGDLDEL